MEGRKKVWKEGSMQGRKGVWKEGRMEGLEERRKKGRTGYLASGFFSSSGVSNKHKNKTFVISGFDFNPFLKFKKLVELHPQFSL